VAFCVISFHISAATVQDRSEIIGGIEAKPNALPWNAAISLNLISLKSQQCGSTIICPRFVITAAHCVKRNPPQPPIQPQDLEIVAGVHDWSKDEPTQSHHKVKMLHIHPEHSRYDIALIELADPIDLRPEARAAFLPDGSEPFQSVPRFIASGWGYWNRTNPQISKVLRSVTIPWVPDDKCLQSYPNANLTQIICAGDFETGEIGGCGGDSGSPLSFLDPRTDQVKVVGLTSGGRDPVCIIPKYPGRYQDIAKQLPWVEGIIGECNKKTCASGWCTTKDDLDPWTIEQFSRITPHHSAGRDQVLNINIDINTLEKA